MTMKFLREHRCRSLGILQIKECVRGVRSRSCVTAVVRCQKIATLKYWVRGTGIGNWCETESVFFFAKIGEDVINVGWRRESSSYVISIRNRRLPTTLTYPKSINPPGGLGKGGEPFPP